MIGMYAIAINPTISTRHFVVPSSSIPESTEATPQHSIVTHLLFLGDIMLDRGVALHAEKYGKESLFSKAQQLFVGHDAIIANLEGTITTNESVARQNNGILRFTFDPTFTDLLKSLNITAVSLANNHSADFGSKGFLETKKNLDERGIQYFGSANNDVQLSTVIRLNKKEICLVGHHDLYTYNEKPVITEIENIREQCSFIIVMPHWGVEYTHVPNDRQRSIAHAFIDAGADVVIGAHPHVVQPVEIYNNKAIFYSLGNFMFDQDFSYATRQGVAIKLELSDYGIGFKLIPTTLTKAEVAIAEQVDRDATLYILAQSDMSDAIKSSIIKTGSFILEK